MKRSIHFCLLFLFAITATGVYAVENQNYPYETVPNDPLKAQIYTLNNGLKVYLTVNKETPRIQTYIAVRVGGKNDPAQNTGLAHYFEHLMFKGSEKFGTQSYALEKPILDQIEQMFEVYRNTEDDNERKAIYQVIDSLSYEASKLAIPNEYDKLMSAIGAKGTNAYTGFDMTVYTEDIPSNQIDNWAKIQADRFKNNVIRGFHTELETVYEEKNMSLTRDARKVNEAMYAALFPHHPYGTQTVLGTQDHLKNPSIKTIKEYYRTWYVPNNMAICVSGDFDPNEMIAVIDKYFGDMKPNLNLPPLPVRAETPLTAPVVREVLGPDAEMVTIGWKLPEGAASLETETSTLLGRIMYNGKAGLLDVDLNQQQKVLNAYGYAYSMADYGMYLLQARPKEGQTLEQVRDLLLAEVEKLKSGNFDEDMLQAIINNFKLYQQQQLEYNSVRADMFVSAFINGRDWKNEVTSLDRMSKLTKADIVAFANKHLGNNYAIIYKKKGQDPNEKKIDKPTITPIVMNRDEASAFLKEIQNTKVTPIEPVFIDYSKDLSKLQAQSGIEVLYKQNVTNNVFQLMYVFDMGNNHDKALGTAFQYMRYLGTSDMSLEEINREFYKLACSFGVSPGSERTYVTLSGLNENMPKALELFEKIMADAQVNAEAYNNLVNDIVKQRNDAKLNQSQNFSRLTHYAMYGPKSPTTNLLTAQELKDMNPQELVNRIKNQNSYKHRIIYYGPCNEKDVLALIKKHHKVPKKLKDIPKGEEFPYLLTNETKIYIAPYEAKQIYMSQISNRDEKFNPAIEPTRYMYNDYFGGGMNSIVFQEMRESRGLAYSAWAGFSGPSKLDRPYVFRSQIATQNDKMLEAIETFNDIINNMPQSEAAFKLAQEGIISRIRTERVIKSSILWSYIYDQDLGQTTDARIKRFNDVPNMTLQDIVKFQEEWIKGRTYTYCILGDEKDLDLEALKKYGTIVKLTTEDIFGY
ncbi:pitrilysin family protein [Bacteroides sp. 519]|uniref:M16 family metallopeptidase n=1 Tax=Bacteroides sp. 519 TaxID=2302937 RepID=UPI0013D1C072|nr:insulinase family protein [Bacteroides sp. 519]NDV57359.1 insulinase family protein [Bacteroides sp. 519]